MSTFKKEIYDFIAPIYDKIDWANNPYYLPIYTKEMEVFDTFVPIASAGKKALDIGCGTGFHTEWLVSKGYQTVAIDVSTQMLDIAREKARAWPSQPEFIKANASEMSDLNGTFDVVICLGGSMNHFENWQRLFNEVAPRINTHGIFIFSFENFFRLDTPTWLFRTRELGYKRSEIACHLSRNLIRLLCRQRLMFYWPIETDAKQIRIPLTYETKWRVFDLIRQAGLKVRRINGIHFLACFSTEIVRANTELHNSNWKSRGADTNSLFRIIENWLTDQFPWLSAATVVVATKP